jgi:hypothetical protein
MLDCTFKIAYLSIVILPLDVSPQRYKAFGIISTGKAEDETHVGL